MAKSPVVINIIALGSSHPINQHLYISCNVAMYWSLFLAEYGYSSLYLVWHKHAQKVRCFPVPTPIRNPIDKLQLSINGINAQTSACLSIVSNCIHVRYPEASIMPQDPCSPGIFPSWLVDLYELYSPKWSTQKAQPGQTDVYISYNTFKYGNWQTQQKITGQCHTVTSVWGLNPPIRQLYGCHNIICTVCYAVAVWKPVLVTLDGAQFKRNYCYSLHAYIILDTRARLCPQSTWLNVRGGRLI